MSETKTATLIERLEDVGCDREPFTDAHKNCICRLTNEAAREITKLTSQLDEARAHLRNVLNYLEDEENAHDIPVGVAEQTRRYLNGDEQAVMHRALERTVAVVAKGETAKEARAKAIEQCAQVAENFAEVTARIDGGIKSTTAAGMWNIAAAIRALIAGSTK